MSSCCLGSGPLTGPYSTPETPTNWGILPPHPENTAVSWMWREQRAGFLFQKPGGVQDQIHASTSSRKEKALSYWKWFRQGQRAPPCNGAQSTGTRSALGFILRNGLAGTSSPPPVNTAAKRTRRLRASAGGVGRAATTSGGSVHLFMLYFAHQGQREGSSTCVFTEKWFISPSWASCFKEWLST